MDYTTRIKILDKEGNFFIEIGKTKIPYVTNYSIESPNPFTRKIHIVLEVPVEEMKLDVNL